MDIKREDIDELNAVIRIKVAPGDYQPRVDEMVKKYQKTASMPGFRPGKMPAGMIRKMHGKSILADELNKILSDSLNKYLTDNQLDILGNPLPQPQNNLVLDAENPTEIELAYDLGLAPRFELNLSPKESFSFYQLEVDAGMIEKYIANIARRHGKFSSPETAGESDILYGEFKELAPDGNEKDGGITTTTSLALEFVKDEAAKNKLIGLKKEDTVVLNPYKAIGDESEVAAMLSIQKENISKADVDFKFTVQTVNRIEKAALNQELFNKLYGDGAVNSEEEFKEKVKGELAGVYVARSNNKLKRDMRDRLLEKTKLSLPDNFLKRWMMTGGEKPLSAEQIEREYDLYANELKWRLVENKIVRDNKINISRDDLKEFAKEQIRVQFAQYGMMSVEEEKLNDYADKYIENQEQSRKMLETLLSGRVFDYLKTVFKIDVKTLPYDDFVKAVQEENV